MKIYKYQLDKEVIELPKGARVLKIAVQYNVLCLWAVVDPNQRLVPKIYVFGTGEELTSDDLFYRDTFLLSGGDLVLHVFEDRNI